MKFIKITLDNGKKITINAEKIIDIFCFDEKHTTISFSESYYYKVKETVEEILKLTKI